MDDYEQRFNDLVRKVYPLYDRRDFQGALRMINDSGLPIYKDQELSHYKQECLWGLGHKEESNVAYLDYAGYTAGICNSDTGLLLLLRSRNYKGALNRINDVIVLDPDKCPQIIDIESCSRVLENIQFCKDKLFEEEKVLPGIIEKVNKSMKDGEYEKALMEDINNSPLLAEDHNTLLAKRAEVLRELGRLEEAHVDVVALQARGYEMSPNINRIIGDKMMSEGNFDGALEFYRTIIDNDSNISNTKRKAYERFIKGVTKAKDKHSPQQQQASGDINLDSNEDQSSSKETKEEKEDQEVHESASEEEGEKVPEAPQEDEEEEETELEVDLKFFYKNFKGKVAQGTMYRRYPRTFILAEESQINKIDELKSLGLENSYIVKIYELGGAFPREVLVTEPVMPLDEYFETLRDSFLKESNSVTKLSWWDFIASIFTPIFGDVVHSLIYLDSLGYTCGDVNDSIFVTAKGVAKVLPWIGKKRNKDLTITHLVAKMKQVLNLPFNDDEISESLPHELLRFLKFVSPDKTNQIPRFWLYNYPFFWSNSERITFTKDLRVFIKENVFPETMFQTALNSVRPFPPQKWDVSVDVLLFQKILNVPPPLGVKPYKMEDPLDLHRYMVACYGHVNDRPYKTFRGHGVTHTQEQVETQLRHFFPTVIVDMYEAIYECGGIQLLDERAVEKLRNWSSSYRAKEERGAELKPRIE